MSNRVFNFRVDTHVLTKPDGSKEEWYQVYLQGWIFDKVVSSSGNLYSWSKRDSFRIETLQDVLSAINDASKELLMEEARKRSRRPVKSEYFYVINGKIEHKS